MIPMIFIIGHKGQSELLQVFFLFPYKTSFFLSFFVVIVYLIVLFNLSPF